MFLTLHEDERDNAYKTMRYVERIFNAMLDRIILFTDYYILKKKITLSESFIFAFSMVWALWLAIFEAESTYNRIWTSLTWSIIFAVISISHFVSFFFTPKLRGFAVSLHAFIWCMLAMLAIYSGTTSLAFPSLAMLSMLSVFVAVRLLKERED